MPSEQGDSLILPDCCPLLSKLVLSILFVNEAPGLVPQVKGNYNSLDESTSDTDQSTSHGKFLLLLTAVTCT